MAEEAKVIDVQVDEAQKLAQLKTLIDAKFAGAPKDVKVWAQLRDELKVRAAEIGFIVEISLDVIDGNWIPVCDIVGRTDKHLEGILETEGPDIERKSFDAKRVSSDELKRQGVNTDLL